MSTRYRLPDSLGGGECDNLRRVPSASGADIVEVLTEADGVTVKVTLHRSLIVEVTPTLPEEPPDDSTVWIAEAQPHVHHRYDHGSDSHDAERWYVPGDLTARSWAFLCALGDPVLLVPDPAAGVEPSGTWSHAHSNKEALRIEDTTLGPLVEIVGGGATYLSREDAEAAGRTLLAAARAVAS